MMHAIREIPIEHLSSSDLLLRYWAITTIRSAGGARLRLALEAMAVREPTSAEVWAALGYIHTHEFSHWFDPQPDPLTRGGTPRTGRHEFLERHRLDGRSG